MDFKDDYQQKEEAVSVNQNQEQPVQQNSYIEDQSKQGLEEAAWAAKVQGGEKQANKTGIPDALKAKLEQEFGFDLSKVRVHYNSDKPAEIGAYAYAEGYNIYIAAGQESHLEHEVRHVIQQLKGEAKATEEIGGKKVDTRKSMEDDADKESVLKDINPLEEQPLKTDTPKPVIQAFIPSPIMGTEINQHKTNPKITSKGWDGNKIDALVQWSKSEKQYQSFVNNLTYAQWQILVADFNTGDLLPVKIKAAWVDYQKTKMNVETIQTNFIGYKGSGGKTWNAGVSYKDWSGCYIATSKEQAEGYIGEAGAKTGTSSLWEITLKREMPVVKFTGGFIDNDDISGEYKAAVLKEVLGISADQKLIQALGEDAKTYLGPAGEDGDELVIPWDLVETFLSYKRIKEYEVNKFYEIKGSKDV